MLDPPFDSGLLAPALSAAARLTRPGGLVYVESGEPLAEAAVAALGLESIRAARAGRVRFHLLRRASQ
jgi:16S rRNA G966 N2-methylase RsmD